MLGPSSTNSGKAVASIVASGSESPFDPTRSWPSISGRAAAPPDVATDRLTPRLVMERPRCRPGFPQYAPSRHRAVRPCTYGSVQRSSCACLDDRLVTRWLTGRIGGQLAREGLAQPGCQWRLSGRAHSEGAAPARSGGVERWRAPDAHGRIPGSQQRGLWAGVQLEERGVLGGELVQERGDDGSGVPATPEVGVGDDELHACGLASEIGRGPGHLGEFTAVGWYGPVQDVPTPRFLVVRSAPHVRLRHQHFAGQRQQRFTHRAWSYIARVADSRDHRRPHGCDVRFVLGSRSRPEGRVHSLTWPGPPEDWR